MVVQGAAKRIVREIAREGRCYDGWRKNTGFAKEEGLLAREIGGISEHVSSGGCKMGAKRLRAES